MELIDESVSLEENGDLEEEHSAKRFKMSNPEFYKPPSAEELYTLKNSENLYQSNLFRLQLDELTNEISLNESELKACNILIKDFSQALKRLKSVQNIKYSDLKMFEEQNLTVPLGNLCKKMLSEGTYSFEAPTECFPIGAHSLGTHLKSSKMISVDLALELPASYFSERDYLNYRYFIKKSLYVSHVYLQLQKTKRYSKCTFEFVANYSNLHSPNLRLNFKEENVQINLFLVPNEASFKLNRFNPTQSNVRREFFSKFINSSISFEKTNEESNDPTPNYNMDILADLTLKTNAELLKEKISGSKNLTESVKLLKLWLLKRGLNQGQDSFDNHTLNMYIAYLL